jgi:hypothetical protein
VDHNELDTIVNIHVQCHMVGNQTHVTRMSAQMAALKEFKIV